MNEKAVSVFRFERRAAVTSLVVGVVLLAIKFVAYFLTGSSAIFSDALESIVNVLASIFALFSIIVAHAPADESHPYGHGKIEFLAAGFEGGTILLAAVIIFVQAVTQLYRGTNTEQLNFGILLIVVAMIVNAAAGLYLVASGKQHGSFTLEADGKHLLADAITSAGVLVALAIVKVTHFHQADPIAAVCIAVYISFLSIGLLRRSGAGLMDQQDAGDDAMIRGILDSHVGKTGKDPRICSYHKLRHRHSGRYHWVDFHILVPAHLNVEQGHQIASAIEYEIEQALGEGNATAHVEPDSNSDVL
ncbi:MAG TPA: cation diffusion facilitator family transporter [Tepidisphaeraceae bacterium]|nr:cation diffusion facilitator family transporter [Tepidisphaeraceae bacterium]